MNKYLGIFYALSAYLWWGVLPMFWKQMEHVPIGEIVGHRMIWACLIALALIAVMRQWTEFAGLFRQKGTMLRLLIAAMLSSANWGIFIWAVNNERIVETSLGYFINPLITVLFGMVFFSERLTKQQMVALLLAASGVGLMIISTGGIPYVSLSLAFTFALYSVIKKKVSMPATHGLAVETLMMLIPATVFLIYLETQYETSFGAELNTSVMLILGGLFTLIPLSLFAAAAKKMTMTALGMTQYIGPSCQLIIAVFIYNEPFGQDRLMAFSLIWLAICVYSVEQLRAQRERRKVSKQG